MIKITYHKEGDYLIPDLIMKKSNSTYNVGKYGHLRNNFLKEHKRGLYTELMINGTLTDHLIDIDKTATARVNNIIDKLAKAENINEALKQSNQLEWVRCMNNIKNRAEEIVFNELIYV